ncbi:MAG: TetR/AcrR family transcriptional regulator [Phycisphaerales bacterium JB039]
MTAARDRLIEAALALFAREGFHAVGIDRIVAEAGVAKQTLYHHFASKEDLMLAAIRRRDETFRLWIARETRRLAPQGGAGQLLAIFDVVAGWIDTDEFRGCLFLKACAEYADPDCALHRAVAEHQRLVTQWLAALAGEAGLADPEELAGAIYLLAQGAIVLGAAQGSGAPARAARRAAEQLLRAGV